MKLLRFLLFPFAILYDLITITRNYLFDIGILKSTKFDIPIIAVGNLSVGGTGKTPLIEYLINLLQKEYSIGVLSRGYKRKSKGYILLNETHSAEDVGDEPIQFFKKFSAIKVAVDADRTNGIIQLINQKNKPEVILLDDAFQHRKVTAGFYILLTKFNDLYSDDFLLPTGNLRENKNGAKRAAIIVVTKCPNYLSDKVKKAIECKVKIHKSQQVFFSTISYAASIKGSKEIETQELSNFKIVLVTGIANPTQIIQFLDGLDTNYHHINFPDHHHFTEKDIVKIQSTFQKISTKNKLILTTEKDYMRLAPKIDNLYYLPIQTKFLDTSKKGFDKKIQEFIKMKKSDIILNN